MVNGAGNEGYQGWSFEGRLLTACKHRKCQYVLMNTLPIDMRYIYFRNTFGPTTMIASDALKEAFSYLIFLSLK